LKKYSSVELIKFPYATPYLLQTNIISGFEVNPIAPIDSVGDSHFKIS